MNPSAPNLAYVYQPATLEFVTVAVQVCLLLEHTAEMNKEEFVHQLLLRLPELYLRTRQLPPSGEEADEDIQHFVSEQDYEYVRAGVKQTLGDDDSYLEVLMEDGRYSDEPTTMFLSENLADIYQELKDMAGNFQTENEEVMTNAVQLCLNMFSLHWGQKALNALRALHALAQSTNED